MGTDDRAIGEREYFRDVVDTDPGVGEHRHAGDRLAHFAQVRLVGGRTGDRPGNEDRVGDG